MVRLADGKEFARIAEEVKGPRYNFDPFAIASNPDNVILTNGTDAGLFEGDGRVYTGHYFFVKAKGKEAIKLAREMLFEMFSVYDARLIKGLTPVENKAALWITRQLGFTSQGIVSHPVGDLELFTLLKEDFK